MAIRRADPRNRGKQIAVIRALQHVNKNVDTGELLDKLIDAWGGVGMLASDVRNEFKEAAPGSMTRQRCLEMIQRLIVAATDRDMAKVVTPREMTDDDLKAYVDKKMAALAAQSEAGYVPEEETDEGRGREEDPVSDHEGRKGVQETPF